MNPLALLHRHFDATTELYHCVVVHSVLVTRRARRIAEDYLARDPDASIDMQFLTEAAMLHDIGIKECATTKIPTTGTEPYICHGVLGRRILEAEGLPRHGLVCERHVGVGLTKEEVLEHGLPLPPRDYLPVSLEEKIICVADKFFSKTPEKLWKREKHQKIERSLARHGPTLLNRWVELRKEILGK